MRIRVIVAAIAIPLLLVLLFFAPLWALSVLVAAISAYSAFELLRCVSPSAPKRFTVYAAVSAFAIAIGCAFLSGNAVPNAALFLLSAVMFAEVLFSYKGEYILKFEAIMKVIFAGGIMPVMLASLVRAGMREHSSIYALIPFVAAFTCDSGAYFAGTYLGKRKIFPHLSPNKTLEGCVGGLAAAVISMVLYAAILSLLKYEVNYFYMALYGLFGGFACQLGDLAFSAIKRQYDIKDFGSLIPGHGGVLDRFDSMHFTAPMVELFIILLPAISAGPAA